MKFKISTTESGKLGGNVFNRNETVRAFAMPTTSESPAVERTFGSLSGFAYGYVQTQVSKTKIDV